MAAPACDLETTGCGCGPHGPADLRSWWRVIAGVLVAANAMTFSLAINSSEATAGQRLAVNGGLFSLSLISVALLGWPLARNAWREARRGRLTIEAMFLAGIGGAMTTSVVAAVTGSGHTYFEVVCILLVVYGLGQQLTVAARDRALRSALEWAPETTVCRVVEEDGGEREIPVTELRCGERFVVNPGETIPADGAIAAGEGFVREAEMTGEGFVAARRPGDLVWAGTHGVDARFEIVATADGAERRIDHILDAVERARGVPSTLQRAADRVVAWFLPVVTVVAAGTFAGWTWHAGWQAGLFNAMAVLLVACPCALGLATPLAVWGALARLAGRGLVARGGDAVEALAAVDTALFDKTGTLTEPRATLVDLAVGAVPGLSEETVRAVLAAVERASDHPVAAAFHDLVGSGGEEPRVLALRLLPGRGVEAEVATVAGGVRRVTVGTAASLVAANDPAWRRLRGRLREVPGAHELAVLIDGEVAAAATVDERLRSSWREALGELRGLGVATAVLTGDAAERALRVGADRVLASLRPEDKVAEVVRLHAEGRRILFVGDGVNDAAAMAGSEVSVAVTSGAELAAEIADISWHSGDLRALPWAIGLARATVGTIRSNLRFALVYNVAGVALAVAGLLHPVAAAILMTCSSLVVTWRATTPFAEEEAEAVADARLRASVRAVGAAT